MDTSNGTAEFSQRRHFVPREWQRAAGGRADQKRTATYHMREKWDADHFTEKITTSAVPSAVAVGGGKVGANHAVEVSTREQASLGVKGALMFPAGGRYDGREPEKMLMAPEVRFWFAFASAFQRGQDNFM